MHTPRQRRERLALVAQVHALEDHLGEKLFLRVGRRLELTEMIERGTCRYLTLFENGIPTELFFVGYSFD